MFVKPNPNKKVGGQKLKVFDPARREFLPDAGRDVPKTPYWQRRLNVGDVVPAEPAKAPANGKTGKTGQLTGSGQESRGKKTIRRQKEQQSQV